jgi:hypothetical protein
MSFRRKSRLYWGTFWSREEGRRGSSQVVVYGADGGDGGTGGGKERVRREVAIGRRKGIEGPVASVKNGNEHEEYKKKTVPWCYGRQSRLEPCSSTSSPSRSVAVRVARPSSAGFRSLRCGRRLGPESAFEDRPRWLWEEERRGRISLVSVTDWPMWTVV